MEKPADQHGCPGGRKHPQSDGLAHQGRDSVSSGCLTGLPPGAPAAQLLPGMSATVSHWCSATMRLHSKPKACMRSRTPRQKMPWPGCRIAHSRQCMRARSGPPAILNGVPGWPGWPPRFRYLSSGISAPGWGPGTAERRLCRSSPPCRPLFAKILTCKRCAK